MKKDKFDPFKELLEKLKQNQIEIKTAEKDKQNQNTDLEIKNAKVKDDGRNNYLNFGAGLYLLISEKYKNWIFRYTFEKKRFTTSFGSYPKVSLVEAKNQRDVYNQILGTGINPKAFFDNLKEKEFLEDNSSLKAIFNEWLETEKSKSGLKQWEWKN